MSEFRANCEQFLATKREHFFAGHPSTAFRNDADGDPAPTASGETHHRTHTGK